MATGCMLYDTQKQDDLLAESVNTENAEVRNQRRTECNDFWTLFLLALHEGDKSREALVSQAWLSQSWPKRHGEGARTKSFGNILTKKSEGLTQNS